MHIEDYEDGNRIVLNNFEEEARVEAFYMVGAGVRCRAVAVDSSDPLQGDFPKTLSAHATRLVFRGMDKVIDGPKLGYLGQDPKSTEKLLESLVPVQHSLNNATIARFIEDADGFGPPPSLA